MTTKLKPYRAYKDSCVEWLGAVPVHWEVRRARYLFTEIDRRSNTGEETHLSMSQRLGLVPSDQVQSSLTSESFVGGKLCEREDLVLNRLKAHLGVFAVANQAGVISPDYSVFRRRCASNMTYFEYALRSPACRGELRVRAKGIVEGFWRLYTDDLYDIRLPVPPLLEQAAIVRFLDHADRRIRRYIRAKEKLIALLEEQKRAIIHEAVTGRIDVRTGRPYPVYKDSGVEWLGEVPAHWGVWRSKRVFRPRTELARPDDVQLSATQAYGVIAQADYEGKISRKVTKILRHLDQRRHVEVDDFVISMRSFQGGLERAWRSGCIRSSYIVLRAATRLIVGYFGHLFKSSGYIAALQSTANFIRDGQDLNFENFCRVDLPFPPIEEQQEIAQAVDKATDHIASSAEQLRRQIGSLSEYRARLIADVVTGKLDVREIVSGLPNPDSLAAERDQGDDFNRRLDSEVSGDSEKGGPAPEAVDAEWSEAAVKDLMADEGR